MLSMSDVDCPDLTKVYLISLTIHYIGADGFDLKFQQKRRANSARQKREDDVGG